MSTVDKIIYDGKVYEIEDSLARQLIAKGLKFVICWDGHSVPDVSKIPAGVKVVFHDIEYIGIFPVSSAETFTFYLVYSATQESENDVFDEYVVADLDGTKAWEKIGDTRINLDDLGALAYKDEVTLSKGDGTNVLGTGAQFEAADSRVSFGEHKRKSAIGANATFSADGALSKTRLSAKASGTEISCEKGDFVKSYPGAKSRLVKVSLSDVKTNTKKSIPNVTSVGSASTFRFAVDNQTLIIEGNNSVAPTLGEPIEASLVDTESKEVASGELSVSGGGAEIMTGLGTPETAKALTTAEVSAQPIITISSGEEGDVEVATDVESISVAVNNSDSVNAITDVGAATAIAQRISVSYPDGKKVALYGDLNVNVN